MTQSPVENDHAERLKKEAQVFAGVNNQKNRAAAFNSIPYIGAKLNEELPFIAEAITILGGRPSIRALTLACGDMKGEYAFFKKIGATSIDAFDISEGQKARCYNLVYDNAIPLNYAIGDVNNVPLPQGQYDVVYMQQSLHHLVEVEKVLQRIHDSMRPDGVFVLNDYIGEPFLQRSPKQRQVCQRIWSNLPERFRTNAAGQVLKTIHIPDKAILSPFEAVRADAILPALDSIFRAHKQVTYGGIVFPILNNFAQRYQPTEEFDTTLIKLLWELDRIMNNGTVEPSFIRGLYFRKTGVG